MSQKGHELCNFYLVPISFWMLTIPWVFSFFLGTHEARFNWDLSDHLPRKASKKSCNLRGHLQRCQMPEIENSRKTAEKGAEWVTVKPPKKQPEKQPKRPENSCFDCFSAVFRVFRLFFRLFFGGFTVTHSAPFSAVFRLFSMSGIWHLCRWPRRL